MKTVPIKENALIKLIEDIAKEEIESKKVEWLAEQKKVWIKETKISVDNKLVERIKALEAQLLIK